LLARATVPGLIACTALKHYPCQSFGLSTFQFVKQPLARQLEKKIFHLYIVSFDGKPPFIVQAVIRRMLDIVEMMFLGIPALLMINYSKNNQRLGDMMAGTTVINTEAICRFCGTELELTPREVVQGSFRCPNCDQVN